MRLAERIQFQTALPGSFRSENRQRTVVQDKTVWIVIDDKDMVTTCEIYDSLVEFLRGRRSRRHIRIVRPQHFDSRQIHLLERLEIRLPLLFRTEPVRDHLRLAQQRRGGIGRIPRVRDKDLVTGIEERQREDENSLFRPDKRLDFSRRVEGHAIIALIPAGKSLPQFGNARIALVGMDPGFGRLIRKCLDCGKRRHAVRCPDS